MKGNTHGVGPLQDALGAPDVGWETELEGEHARVEGGEVVVFLSARHHLCSNNNNVNFNPKRTGVKHFLIVLGGGDGERERKAI